MNFLQEDQHPDRCFSSVWIKGDYGIIYIPSACSFISHKLLTFGAYKEI